MRRRALRGTLAQSAGMRAEQAACDALVRDGWDVLSRRHRTAAGEIDILAQRDGLLAIIEVKHRPKLAEAAFALGPRQRARLLAAAEIVLGANPDWGREGVRFDLLLVDAGFTVRRIADAVRAEG